MRIRQERLDSNIRVSQLEAEFAKVIVDAPDGVYVEEIVLALLNVQNHWVNVLRNHEIPSIEKEADEEADEGSTT